MKKHIYVTGVALTILVLVGVVVLGSLGGVFAQGGIFSAASEQQPAPTPTPPPWGPYGPYGPCGPWDRWDQEPYGPCGPYGPYGPMGPGSVTPAPTTTVGGAAGVSYRRDIQPIFTQNCVACHGGSAGLWLDRYERVMAGSSRGPVVVPGNPEQSEIYRRITGLSQPAMPLRGPRLNQPQIDAIRAWIAAGAPNN